MSRKSPNTLVSYPMKREKRQVENQVVSRQLISSHARSSYSDGSALGRWLGRALVVLAAPESLARRRPLQVVQLFASLKDCPLSLAIHPQNSKGHHRHSPW